jgi:hypothetical protein
MVKLKAIIFSALRKKHCNMVTVDTLLGRLHTKSTSFSKVPTLVNQKIMFELDVCGMGGGMVR